MVRQHVPKLDLAAAQKKKLLPRHCFLQIDELPITPVGNSGLVCKARESEYSFDWVLFPVSILSLDPGFIS
jgi:hypothetical protein